MVTKVELVEPIPPSCSEDELLQRVEDLRIGQLALFGTSNKITSPQQATLTRQPKHAKGRDDSINEVRFGRLSTSDGAQNLAIKPYLSPTSAINDFRVIEDLNGGVKRKLLLQSVFSAYTMKKPLC